MKFIVLISVQMRNLNSYLNNFAKQRKINCNRKGFFFYEEALWKIIFQNSPALIKMGEETIS